MPHALTSVERAKAPCSSILTLSTFCPPTQLTNFVGSAPYAAAKYQVCSWSACDAAVFDKQCNRLVGNVRRVVLQRVDGHGRMCADVPPNAATHGKAQAAQQPRWR